MRLDGSIEIAASADAVWRLVIDPTRLAACVPGVSDVRTVDDRTFEGKVTAAVGPLDGQFEFRSVIVRADFPSDLAVEVEGVDSVTRSRLVADVTVSLASTTATATTLTYRATVSVKGRLAILGEMVLRATASLMIGQATRCIRSQLEMDPGGGPTDPAHPARAPGG